MMSFCELFRLPPLLAVQFKGIALKHRVKVHPLYILFGGGVCVGCVGEYISPSMPILMVYFVIFRYKTLRQFLPIKPWNYQYVPILITMEKVDLELYKLERFLSGSGDRITKYLWKNLHFWRWHLFFLAYNHILFCAYLVERPSWEWLKVQYF